MNKPLNEMFARRTEKELGRLVRLCEFMRRHGLSVEEEEELRQAVIASNLRQSGKRIKRSKPPDRG